MSSLSANPDAALQALLRLVEGSSVLYVEDEPEIRAEMREMLEAVFSRVVTAGDGAEAWEKFQAEEFLIVITDINMPNMTGIELIQTIQKVKPQQAVLVTSAHSDAANLIPLINLGVGSFLLKPLNWKVFLSLIHKEASAALASQQDARYQQRLEREVKLRTEEVRQMQQQLVRLQEAKDNMLSLISHELRTPLNGILGFVELLRSEVEVPEALSFLTRVEESARRLERSTRKALDFANLSAGTRSINREDHSVEELLTTARVQVVPGDRPLNVDWQGSPDALLYTDAILTVEMFRNLLENSAKYGDAGTVQVSFFQEGNWDVLSFRDDGPGFSETVLTTLFQPFSTGDIMHHAEGMGLGLALVDVIMLTLGGRAQAVNRTEGGAEVRLKFPRKL